MAAITTTTTRSKSRLLVTAIIAFFHLENTTFDWEYLFTDKQYMKRLAFLGDAVLKPYVVTELIRREGICCAGLYSRTESYITNKNLSLIFDKLSFGIAMSLTVPSFFGLSLPSTKLMGTIIESMLRCTEMYCPEYTYKVVVVLMELMEKSNLEKPKAADCCAFKVGKHKPRIKTCLGKPATSQRAHAKAAATKDTLLVKYSLAECENKAVATPSGQSMPKEQKHAMQHMKRRKKKRSQKLLGVRGGITKKSKSGSIHVRWM